MDVSLHELRGDEHNGERMKMSTVDTWIFTLDGKMLKVETPSDLSMELWRKLDQYVNLLKPEPEIKTQTGDGASITDANQQKAP